MPSTINKLMVAELEGVLRDLDHVLLVDFTGLSAGQADQLRGLLQKQGARIFVVKNSLVTLALGQLGLPGLAELVRGPTALVAGGDGPALVARTLLEWARRERVLRVYGGFVDGRVLSAEQVRALSELPPLAVLRAQAVGAIAAPLTTFIGALQGIVRSFVSVVKAIGEQRQQAG